MMRTHGLSHKPWSWVCNQGNQKLDGKKERLTLFIKAAECGQLSKKTFYRKLNIATQMFSREFVHSLMHAIYFPFLDPFPSFTSFRACPFAVIRPFNQLIKNRTMNRKRHLNLCSYPFIRCINELIKTEQQIEQEHLNLTS